MMDFEELADESEVSSGSKHGQQGGGGGAVHVANALGASSLMSWTCSHTAASCFAPLLDYSST